MIGTAMMIAVIGQHESSSNLDARPWEVDQLENGNLRVFDVTLGKTTIQEVNQIFASFAETYLISSLDNNDKQSFQLIAYYNELVIDGLIAAVEITYEIDQKDLDKLFQSLDKPAISQNDNNKVKRYKISKAAEISYLNSAVATITYIPSIDFGMESIRQRFGTATDEVKINKEEQLWVYPDLGLEIHIHASQPDRFVYSALK